MEIRKNIRSTVTNTEGKAFTIKASAKAFRILSDGLYSDKITAIIRELGTNAYDAHVSIKNADKPFRVHLPIFGESYFSIRDYGNSMTHDQVMELYTTYFGSDKTDSNEFVGALGLGSKSPFSYTDSFTITAILDGDMRHYVAFMDKDGTPTISLLNQQKTREENGLEVRFDVQPDDISSWNEKAKHVYRFFPVKPEMTGNTNYHHFIDKPYITGDTWSLMRKDGWRSDCFALQGNIAYKIESGYFSSNKASFIAQNNFHVKFDIGQLDVSASRESLSYDKITIMNIEARFIEVYDEFALKANQTISLEKSEWYAKIKAHEIVKDMNLRHCLIFEYKSNILDDLNHYNISFDDFSQVKIIKYWKHSTYRSEYIKRTELTKKQDKWGVNKGIKLPVDNDSIFIEDDNCKLKIPRVRLHAETTGKNVYLIECATRKFYTSIGKPDVIKVSKLKIPPRKPSSKPVEGKYYSEYNVEKGIFTEGVTKTNLPKGKKYFMEIKSGHALKNGHKIASIFIVDEIKLAIELGLIEHESQIFGVSSREIKTKKFSDLKMIDFFDHIHKQTLNRVSVMKNELDDYFKSYVKNNSLSNMSRLSREVMQSKTLTSKVSPNSKVFDIHTQILEIKDEFENFQTETNDIKQLIDMAQRCSVEITKPEFKYEVDSLEDYYPMLAMISHYSYDIDKVIDYINLVDASKV